MMKKQTSHISLGQVADFRRGLTYAKGDEDVNGSIGVLRSTNIDLENSELDLREIKQLRSGFVVPDDKSVKKDSILICMSNGSYQHLGKVAYIDKDYPYAFGGFMGLILPNHEIVEPMYVYYALRSAEFKRFVESCGKGININNLKFSDLSHFLLPDYDRTGQIHVITELGLLDSIIRKKKEQLNILDELEMSVFYDSFGNPVTNNRDWETMKLSEITSLITDGSHYSPKDEEMGTIPMLSVKNMGARGFDYTDCKMISQEEFKKLEAAGCKPMPDDVLVAKDGSYFKKIFVHQSEAPQAILSSIAIVRPDQTKVTPEFLCTLLSTPDIYNLVEERYLTGTAIKRVILKGLRQLKIIVPPMDMQKQFSKKIWRINAQRRLIEESVVEAQKLFDSRMNYYFGD